MKSKNVILPIVLTIIGVAILSSIFQKSPKDHQANQETTDQHESVVTSTPTNESVVTSTPAKVSEYSEVDLNDAVEGYLVITDEAYAAQSGTLCQLKEDKTMYECVVAKPGPDTRLKVTFNGIVVISDHVEVIPMKVVKARALQKVPGLMSSILSTGSETSAPSLNRDQAVSLINQWLQAKSEIFVPPFSSSKIDSLTTGRLYSDLTGRNGPVSWLKNNNAYYKFGTRRIDSVNSFSASANSATIEVTVTESRTLYVNGSVDSNSSGTDTSDIRYSLERSNGVWKISDFQVMP